MRRNKYRLHGVGAQFALFYIVGKRRIDAAFALARGEDRQAAGHLSVDYFRHNYTP